MSAPKTHFENRTSGYTREYNMLCFDQPRPIDFSKPHIYGTRLKKDVTCQKCIKKLAEERELTNAG